MTSSSLQAVLDEMKAFPDRWPTTTYPKIVDSLVRLSRLLNHPLADLPACSATIADIIDTRLNWRTGGFSTEAAFRDFAGRIKRAIRQTTAGQGAVPTFTRAQHYSPEWRTLIVDIETAVRNQQAAVWIRRSIAHLAGFANSRNKGPRDVDNALLAELLQLHAVATGRSPGSKLPAKAISSARTWNHLIDIKEKSNPPWLANFPVGLPRLEWGSRKKQINPPQESWPATLRAEIDQLMTQVRAPAQATEIVGRGRLSALMKRWETEKDPAGGKRRRKTRRSGLSPATIENFNWALRQSVGALVRAGTPLADITSLEDLLNLEAVAISLEDYEARHHANRPQGDHPASLWQLATALGSLHRRQMDSSDEELEMLADLRAACRTDSCGTMAVARKKLLWQFDEPRNLLAWLDRPEELVRRAEAKRRKSRVGPAEIADIETAILCRLVSVLPVRRANLCSIRFAGEDRHLVLARHEQESSWIVWPAREVKNHRWLRAEIDKQTEKLIRLYLEHYRPVYLTLNKTPDSQALFPGIVSDQWGSGHRDPASLGGNFSSRMKEAGLEMTLHLARHLAARIVLDLDPAMLPLVADLLGDSISTVQEYYVEGRTERASAAYRQVLEEKALKLRLEWKPQATKEINNG